MYRVLAVIYKAIFYRFYSAKIEYKIQTNLKQKRWNQTI